MSKTPNKASAIMVHSRNKRQIKNKKHPKKVRITAEMLKSYAKMPINKAE